MNPGFRCILPCDHFRRFHFDEVRNDCLSDSLTQVIETRIRTQIRKWVHQDCVSVRQRGRHLTLGHGRFRVRNTGE